MQCWVVYTHGHKIIEWGPPQERDSLFTQTVFRSRLFLFVCFLLYRRKQSKYNTGMLQTSPKGKQLLRQTQLSVYIDVHADFYQYIFFVSNPPQKSFVPPQLFICLDGVIKGRPSLRWGQSPHIILKQTVLPQIVSPWSNHLSLLSSNRRGQLRAAWVDLSRQH